MLCYQFYRDWWKDSELVCRVTSYFHTNFSPISSHCRQSFTLTLPKITYQKLLLKYEKTPHSIKPTRSKDSFFKLMTNLLPIRIYLYFIRLKCQNRLKPVLYQFKSSLKILTNHFRYFTAILEWIDIKIPYIRFNKYIDNVLLKSKCKAYHAFFLILRRKSSNKILKLR